jgi:hypothetical protein
MKYNMEQEKDIKKQQDSDNNGKTNTLEVKIVSNWSLLEILSDRKKVLKTILSLLILVFTIFIGLAFVTISIKRIYPYNDIKVNSFGVTSMQNEDVEIIYWLFNTADLWANSGIQVRQGDILTIRASGRSHTAIHHLVDNVTNNKKLSDNWVGTDGDYKRSFSKRDSLRMQYRLFPNRAQDALIMQVIPEKAGRGDIEELKKYLTFDDKDNKDNKHKENIYFIGKERVDLLINNDGFLHFAVNDIVLTDAVIDKMCAHNDSLIRSKLVLKNENISERTWKERIYLLTNNDGFLHFAVNDIVLTDAAIDKICAKNDSLIRSKLVLNSIPDDDWKKYNEDFFDFGNYPDSSKITQHCNEMTYYKKIHYNNAWFDDNIGSFLIVVERKKNK